MAEVARVDDPTACVQMTPVGTPHVGGPLETASKVCAEVNGLQVIRVADYSQCEKPAPKDVVMEGAATVTLCGLPIARVGDGMLHLGTITAGSPDVVIGGAAFDLPDNIIIDGDSDFVHDVIRDMYMLSTTRTGEEVFSRLEAAGEIVTIIENPDPNGFASPTNSTDAQNGTPTGSQVRYNPSYRSNAYDDAGNVIAQPAQVILLHELVHAMANSEGTHRYGTDPTPPASQSNIAEEEAQAIGTGSHDGEFPNENSLREDLGLDRRDNHFGTGGPTSTEPTPVELRPGDC